MREYTKDDYGFLMLDLVDNIPLPKKVKIAKIIERGSNMWNLGSFKEKLLTVLDEREYRILVSSIDNRKLKKFFKFTTGKKVDFITLNSPEYPKRLAETVFSPFILYYVGDLRLLKTNCIAIVGSRLSTFYGTSITQTYAKELAFNGFTIVSGLAEGIDTVAHKACLDVKGKTIAVLCGGLNNIYPEMNRGLARQIIRSGGLAISEQRIGIPPQAHYFPIRNRIIAGLSLGVVLTEARKSGGTRYTIYYSEIAGREVYCVPHTLQNQRGAYGNELIKQCQTCLTLSPQDVVEDLGFRYKGAIEFHEKVTALEDADVTKLREIISQEESVHFNVILEKTGFETKKLNRMLTDLELGGLIKKCPGNYFSWK